MSYRSKELRLFLTKCLNQQIDINNLSDSQVVFLIEVCHNVITNPNVLLSAAELRCLKSGVKNIDAIGRTRQLVEGRALLKKLKRCHLPYLARIGLDYTK